MQRMPGIVLGRRVSGFQGDSMYIFLVLHKRGKVKLLPCGYLSQSASFLEWEHTQNVRIDVPRIPKLSPLSISALIMKFRYRTKSNTHQGSRISFRFDSICLKRITFWRNSQLLIFQFWVFRRHHDNIATITQTRS